ncbi:MAG: inositol monophosphatase family protein [Actinomycetota bacterium]
MRAACVAAEDIVGLVEGLRGRPDVGVGADGAATKAADRAAETSALGHLGRLGIPICSEERGHVGGRPDARARWIAVDPIDGTRNYLRSLPPYGFAAGLVDAGRPVAGVVVDLTSGRRWIGRQGEGATVDGRPCVPRAGGPVAVPSVAPGDDVGPLPSGHSRVRMSGSTTIDLCRVADGSLGAFVDLRRRVVHVHDLAGPLAVLVEAGVPVTTGDGSPPELPPDPRWTTSLLVGTAARSVAVP